MFFGAGITMRAYGTKEIALIHGVGCRFPTEGALWLAGAIAITGAPAFGLFLSEFTIMRAGLKPPFSWAVYVMAILLIVIFIGFMNHFRVAPIFGPYLFAPLEKLVISLAARLRLIQSGHVNFYLSLIGALLVIILFIVLF
jgi:hydrogenase-4 component F